MFSKVVSFVMTTPWFCYLLYGALKINEFSLWNKYHFLQSLVSFFDYILFSESGVDQMRIFLALSSDVSFFPSVSIISFKSWYVLIYFIFEIWFFLNILCLFLILFFHWFCSFIFGRRHIFLLCLIPIIFQFSIFNCGVEFLLF